MIETVTEGVLKGGTLKSGSAITSTLTDVASEVTKPIAQGAVIGAGYVNSYLLIII